MNFSNFKALTRLEHIPFGLPYLLSSMILALTQTPFSLEIGRRLFWILCAFLLARISGMAFNQWIDHKIDALNPRTQHRPIPSGKVTPKKAGAVAWAGLVGFVLCCLKISFLCFLFGCLAAFLIFIYSFMKRIHASCHFVLGAIHFLSPFMTWIAITDSFNWIPILLGLAAFFSLSANDILYAIQDYQFDRQHHLHSIPAKLGLPKSISLGQILHGFCFLSLLLLGILAKLPLFYYGAPLLALVVLFYFPRCVNHSLEGKEDLFFLNNSLVSLGTMVFILSGVLWRVL